MALELVDDAVDDSMDLLSDDCLLVIFQYIPYDGISKLRLVSKRFNILCGQTLNKGFTKLRGYHSRCVREIKDALPRRESERRRHELYPRHDMLQAIDTRISLLTMTYGRLSADGVICFIPGKVLDELRYVLNIIQNHGTPLKTSSLPFLQELRDISSMAMEHFDEHILPRIEAKHRILFRTNLNSSIDEMPKILPLSGTVTSSCCTIDGEHNCPVVIECNNRILAQSKAIHRLEQKNKRLIAAVNEQRGRVSDLEKQLSVIQGRLGIECLLPSVEAGSSGSMSCNRVVDTEHKDGEISAKRQSEECFFCDSETKRLKLE